MDLTCDVAIVPDWLWAVMTILQEARNQSLDGMIGVAEVIRDRTKLKYFSDGTISSTVLWPYQFSGWNTKDPNRIFCADLKWDDPRVQMAVKAWTLANKNNTSLVGGALFYHAKTMNPFPDWVSKMTRTTMIQDHIFYKEVS